MGNRTNTLRIVDAGLALHGHWLFERLSLTVAAGEIVTVMGPSGVGKSSLLAWICGTLDPGFETRGQVSIGAREITALAPEHRRIGILFQDDLLFPHLSVADNLAFALASHHRRGERRARIDAALAEAGLEGFGGRDPATLSGGQRARVALMRTLLAEPEALLLDEPFGKLDVNLRRRMREFVFKHTRSRGLPMLMVTHDPADAEAAGGKVIHLEPPANAD